MNKQEIYAAVTEKIIANLESSGTWMKLWQIPSPISLMGRYYTGINQLLLSADKYSSRVYGTYKQIRENGGQVRKDEKATLIVFWKKSKGIDKITEKERLMFFLQYYFVFNTDQADFDEQGLQKIAKLQGMVTEKFNDAKVHAEQIIEGYKDCPPIQHRNDDDRAYYVPSSDIINIPDRKYFVNSDAYYKVLFHEMGHSTGHPSRLNRENSTGNKKGDTEYSKEELVAELCSAYLSSIADLNVDIRNSAAYIKSWSEELRSNENWVMWAASRSMAAANHILGIIPETAHVEEPALVEAE